MFARLVVRPAVSLVRDELLDVMLSVHSPI
jgi:hypothetical protein